MTVDEIISKSSNVGTITLAEQVGEARLSQWIKRFGFGAKTGIDFGRDAGDRSCTRALVGVDDRNAADRARHCRHARADGSRLCNRRQRGCLAAHVVVAKVGSIQRPAYAARRPLAERRPPGDGHDARRGRRGHGPGGCTARIPGGRQDRNSGEARCERWLLEVGLRRVVRGRRSRRTPRIVVLVTIDEPRGAIWGGTVAAPAFADIARFALQYLEVPPDAPETLPARE